MRIRLLGISIFFLTACQPQMANHGHVLPNTETLGERPAGVVSWRSSGLKQAGFPPLSRAALKRGKERYEIYCSPCHGLIGDGHGMIVTRGFSPPPSFHKAPLLNASDQHYFDTITHGDNKMWSYADRISVEDRWNIIHYIRALQLSQNFDLRNLSSQEINRLSEKK